MKLAQWARILSRSWLNGPLPECWERSRLAGAEAERIASAYGDDAELLIAAAYLHEVGRAPDLAVTGCVPLDGARYLLTTCGPARLAALVAHQPCMPGEYPDQIIGHAMSDFAFETTPVRDALWYCIATTGSDDPRRAMLGEGPDVASAIYRTKARTAFQHAL